MSDIFSIFNPDWWVDENNNALQIADAVLYLLLAIIPFCMCSFFIRQIQKPLPAGKNSVSFSCVIYSITQW